ncbi:YdjY domain-containing protein [Verrucomicrobiota bacterium sgz303538]
MNTSRFHSLRLFVSAFIAFSGATLVAQEPGAPTPVPPVPAPGAPAPAGGVIKEVGPGVYELGLLRIEKEKNTVTFPGKLNMAKGILEYLLVGPQGSTHESLLVTDAPVTDVHTAMLLLGAKGSGIHAPSPQDQPPAQITNEYLKSAPELKGDRIFITVRWHQDGADKEGPVEDWLVNTHTKKAAERGPWIYNGSMFGADGKFLAQQEQAFAALLPYPVALINNPRKGNETDTLWGVNEKAVPVVDTPVQISIRLETPAVKPQ